MANGIKAGVNDAPEPQPLKAGKAHWDEGKVKELLQRSPETLDKDEAMLVIRELDRRFMQLWDKVAFEREHGLVDYDKLKKG